VFLPSRSVASHYRMSGTMCRVGFIPKAIGVEIMQIKSLIQHHRLLYGLVILIFLIFLVFFILLVSSDTAVRESTKPVFPLAGLTEPTTKTIALDIEDQGKIIVIHGSACGESDLSGEEMVVELPGNFTLPAYANAATVFLNGWKLRYLDNDEELRALSANIINVEISGGELSWRAQGYIMDSNFKDGYEFCYNYTVIAWNDGLVDAFVNHSIENHSSDCSFFDDDTTALGASSSYVENTEFTGKQTVAILPRGFEFVWARSPAFFTCGWPPVQFDCPVDRHLLQIGYNMDHGESFVEQGKDYDVFPNPVGLENASRFDQTIRSWESYYILKDNHIHHDYYYGEFFSALGGNDIGVIEPPFTILPREDIGFFAGCLGTDVKRTKEVEILDVPFDYAIPMLTGWEIGYHCDDQHVKDIGIWLEDIEFEKDPAESTGTLRYTVVSELRDDDTFPGQISSHKVNILGINGREPADLVPYELAVQFCNKDSLGRLLVSVANIGADDAPGSTTRLEFEDGSIVEVETPPIAANFIGTLEPIAIPPSCPGSDCDFTIIVDSNSEVTETNELNNVANGRCIG